MKKMRRLLALLLVICMMQATVAGCGSNTAETTKTEETAAETDAAAETEETAEAEEAEEAATLTVELTDEGGSMYKYGHLEMNISTEEFLKTFEYGDIVNVELLGNNYEFPVCADYGDVDTYGYLIRAAAEKTVVLLGINNGTFGVDTGFIEPAAEGSEFSYQLVEGVEFPATVTITLKEKGGYTDQIELHRLVRTNERSEYPELNDEQYANFRMVTTPGIAEGKLYRSSNPVNPELGRNTYADAAAEAAGVKCFVNLADTKEEAEAYEGYADSYYSQQNILFLGLPVAFASDEFRSGLVDAFIFMSENDGPYLVHCTEGKDRAGVTSAILECLMGASVEEICEDYLTTFRNYYNVEDGVQVALSAEQEDSLRTALLNILCPMFGIEDAASADLAAEAEEFMTEYGMTADQIAALKANLSE